jgi:hypothetical protein
MYSGRVGSDWRDILEAANDDDLIPPVTFYTISLGGKFCTKCHDSASMLRGNGYKPAGLAHRLRNNKDQIKQPPNNECFKNFQQTHELIGTRADEAWLYSAFGPLIGLWQPQTRNLIHAFLTNDPPTQDI